MLLGLLLLAGTSVKAAEKSYDIDNFLSGISSEVLLTIPGNHGNEIPLQCFALRSRGSDDFDLTISDRDEVIADNYIIKGIFPVFTLSEKLYSQLISMGGLRNTKYMVIISDLPPPEVFKA